MRITFFILNTIFLLSCNSGKEADISRPLASNDQIVTDTTSIEEAEEIDDGYEGYIEFEGNEGIMEGKLLSAGTGGTPHFFVKDTAGAIAYFYILNDFQFAFDQWNALVSGKYENKMVRVNWKKSEISLKEESIKRVPAVTKFEFINESSINNIDFLNAVKERIEGYDEICLERLDACTFLPKGVFEYKGNKSSMVISATYDTKDSAATITIYHQRFQDDQFEKEETTAEDQFQLEQKYFSVKKYKLDSISFTGDSYVIIGENKTEGRCSVTKWIYKNGQVVTLTMEYNSKDKELFKDMIPVIVTNFRFKTQ